MLASEMVTAVKTQAAFDTSGVNVTDATILSWLNARYRTFVSQTKWLKQVIELGPTVVSTRTYAIPDTVAEIRALELGSEGEALRVNVEGMWALRAKTAWLSGPEVTAYAPSFDAAGAQSVEIYPTPTTAGVTISALVAALPSALTTSPDLTPVIPIDFHEAIVSGAIAMGYLRTDARADLAAPYETEFTQAIALLKRRATARVGQGPVRFPIAGRDF